MQKITYLFCLGCIISCILSCQAEHSAQRETPSEQQQYERLVSLSGSITETLFALGQGEHIIGIDVTSTYPAEQLKGMARLGHVKQLNVEALLQLQPDLVLAELTAETSAALRQLEDAGIDILWLEADFTLEKPMNQARKISEKLNLDEVFQQLNSEYNTHRLALEDTRQIMDTAPNVLFIYARGKGSLMVAGQNTAASAMIELAGGKNAIQEFEGFRALSAEGLIAANPDVLLLFDSGLESLGGIEGLLQVPGLAQTNAGRKGHIIGMDGLYLLGFTPRAPQAASDLSIKLQSFNQALTANTEGLK
ncbi:MAG: ABC transporter substrate-binding protein [Phaeodactylibacter sp.]|nr:ABC transporter substrate-binding protein [Phaeodactylibacter sp.]